MLSFQSVCYSWVRFKAALIKWVAVFHGDLFVYIRNVLQIPPTERRQPGDNLATCRRVTSCPFEISSIL